MINFFQTWGSIGAFPEAGRTSTKHYNTSQQQEVT